MGRCRVFSTEVENNIQQNNPIDEKSQFKKNVTALTVQSGSQTQGVLSIYFNDDYCVAAVFHATLIQTLRRKAPGPVGPTQPMKPVVL
jgi:hypothetical protein